jgi:hypothetical protein
MGYPTVADDVDESKDALDGEDVRQHRPPGTRKSRPAAIILGEAHGCLHRV